MSREQVFNEITKNKKWYVGIYIQQTASQMVKRFNNGSLSHEKMNEIFNKFGYIKIIEQWQKDVNQIQQSK